MRTVVLPGRRLAIILMTPTRREASENLPDQVKASNMRHRFIHTAGLLFLALTTLLPPAGQCQLPPADQGQQAEPQIRVPAKYGKQRHYAKPENLEAVKQHLQAAKDFEEANRLDDAINEYVAVLNLEPLAAPVWVEVGLLFERQGDLERAFKSFEKVTQIDPGNAFGKNKFKSLQAMIKDAQKRGPSPPRIAAAPPPAATKQQPPDRPIKDKWALVIGISNFQHKEYNLGYAAKDAKDFYNYLIKDAHFKPDHVLLLLDENATKQNIISAFGSRFLPAVAEPDDLVVVFLSTHGTPKTEDQGGRNYIVAHDTDIKDLYATGVDMDEVLHRVKEAVKSDRALIVMDACYSGGGVPGAKGMGREANFDANQIAQGFGHLVMSSSSPNERSWESRTTPNGVFTKYLLEALRQDGGNVDIKKAFSVAHEKIGWEVKNAYQARQTPQLGGDWEGKQLILSAPAASPREIFNPDLLDLIKKCSPPGSSQ
jgi:uncharacterized caspase-like protein